MTLQRINRTAPAHESLIRVYDGKIVFNANASRLLDLHPNALVSVCFDKESYEARGVKRLYVGVSRNGYKVKPRCETFFVSSASLSRDIANALEGFGTYRICPEDYSKDTDGTKYYNIFFKKYD